MMFLAQLLRIPLAYLYGIITVAIFLFSIPFVAMGFFAAFIKWTWEIGETLFEKVTYFWIWGRWPR